MVIRPIRPPPPLRWFGGDESAYPQRCSACGGAIADGDGPPLLMFKADGSALLRFCNGCQGTYFGIRRLEEEED